MAKAQAMRTHCPQGHPYDEENTTYTNGRRVCRACSRAKYHARRPPKASFVEKLWQRFEPASDGCWLWTGAMQNAGYGSYGKPSRLAHRLMYELLVEPIPAGLVIDHLCRNRRCVNPAHMEVVTLAENVLRGESPPARNARKKVCPVGHAYDAENTYIVPSTGHRQCLACQSKYVAARGRGGDAT
ncbi:HNH endonuclease signature motif containing protein [Nitrosomonas sp.]|uniref:HNH endonuclease signature motif containing protein n=1 Tax=Nitrosomonas sp. TaxID=42353 RepID=UPI0025E64E5F|nr:HNH endonuclease signature motif containing protein [Nitrosomonas sp.]